MSAAASDAIIVSQLKASLVTDRTLHYEDSIPVRANVRYPLMMEDRLSIELWPLPVDLEQQLIESESDTSDNNLGITFEHRLSLWVIVCDRCSNAMPAVDNRRTVMRCSRCGAMSSDHECIVRVSLRACLNEYHEISYHFEMECEEDEMQAGKTTGSAKRESIAHRRRRHDAIATVFRDVALTMLMTHWPQGLMRECVPYTPERAMLETHREPIRMTSGRSYFTNERLFSALFERMAAENGDARAEVPIAARLKYDGERAFGWYAMGEFWVNSERVDTIEPNMRDLLCGLYIYQLETERRRRNGDCSDDSPPPRRRHVITEVAFFISHRQVVAINGGGALSRQIEVPENAYSIEQRTPATAYILRQRKEKLSETTPSYFWDELRAFLLTTDEHRSVTRCFLRTCAEWPVSYVATALWRDATRPAATYERRSFTTDLKPPASSMRYRLTLGKLTRDLFDGAYSSTDAILRTWLSIGSHDDHHRCPLERALIPLTLDYSLHFLHRMHETLDGGDHVDRPGAPVLSVSRTYSLPTEFVDLWRHYHHRATVDNSEDFALDGLLLLMRPQRPRRLNAEATDVAMAVSRYEKMKLHQTIEVFVRRDPLTLCSRDHGTFAVFRCIIAHETSRCVSRWRIRSSFVDESNDRDERSLTIFDMPIPVTDNGRIAELEYRGSRFDDEDVDIVTSNATRGESFHSLSRRAQQERDTFLRFVRWRDDKEHCDKRAKVFNILRNR